MRLMLLFLVLAISSLVSAGESPALVPPRANLGDLGVAATYRSADGVLDLDISEYAGYAGLVVANGGLATTADSFVASLGLKLRLRLSESENWARLNGGAFAATVTTADVLALLGPQMKVAVPLLLSYSRGADGVLGRSGIKTVNDLVGKSVIVSQFNESEFLLRYLAQEADLKVANGGAAKDAINLLFAEDGFAAGDAFLAALDRQDGSIAGCVSWSPKTTEVIAAASGKARVVTTNRNLLVIADVLLLNHGFAREHPEQVQGIVRAVLEGNRRLRQDPQAHLAVIGAAFGWDAAQTRRELDKVHLANRAENLAFFNGTMDAAGSFSYILQSANLVYADYQPEPVDPAALLDLRALDALGAAFPGESVTIRPITAGDGAQVEPTAVVKRDIRFLFEPNSPVLDATAKANSENLKRLGDWLRASPGSVLLLVGHVEPSQRDRLRKLKGNAEADSGAEQLGAARSAAVRDALIRQQKADPDRLVAQSRGWAEPIPGLVDMAGNRRVEVVWKLLE